MKVEKVVIGIDFSPSSVEAAQWVSRHFSPGTELVLAHVISLPAVPPIVRSRFPQRELLVDTLREGAEKKLKEISLSLGIDRAWLEIREGEPVETLTTLAGEFAAGLVVAGAHGERGLQSTLGSTAEHLVRASTHPVLLVANPRPRAPRHILVPLDRQEDAPAALEWAGVLSLQHQANVTTIHVSTGGMASGALAALAVVSGSPPIDVTLPHSVSAAPDQWVESAVAAGIPREQVSSEMVDGEPVQQILAAQERLDTDLIVMPRRSAGNLRRAVLGSVVAGVLRDAPCPILVVPETPAGDDR